MKTTLLFLTATAVAATAFDPVPKAFEKQRYAQLFAKSPFGEETKPPPPPPPGEDPFAGAYVTSMSLDAGGRTVVYVRRPGSEQGIKLVGAEPDAASGYSVLSVNWTKKLKDATVLAKHSSGIEKTLQFSDKAPAIPVNGGGKKIIKGPTTPGPIPPKNPNEIIRIRDRDIKPPRQ